MWERPDDPIGSVFGASDYKMMSLCKLFSQDLNYFENVLKRMY